MISFSLFATYQDFDKYKGLFTHLHMNSLNIIVDFSTYMYFRELRIWHGLAGFPAAFRLRVIRVQGLWLFPGQAIAPEPCLFMLHYGSGCTV